MSTTERVGSCFLVSSDVAYCFPDVAPILEGLGAFVFEVNDETLADSLIQLFHREATDRAFDLSLVPRSALNTPQIVLAMREVRQAQAIAQNLESNEDRDELPVIKAIGSCARRLAELAVDLRQILDDAAGDASLSAGNSYSLRNCLLPKLHEPQSLMASLDLLVYVLERHRLIFLHFMTATRVNPLAITGRTGIHERVTHEDVFGKEEYIKQIDCDDDFLFRCRWFLDNYAVEAISRFGPGEGVKPDVDGASHPYWLLEEGGAGYLQESADTIYVAVRHVQRLDTGRQFDISVQRAIEVAYDRGNSRWYSPLITRWEYFFELDSAIASIKRDTLLLARPEQAEQAPLSPEGGSFYLSVTYDENIFNHDPAILGKVVGDPNYLPVGSGTLYFFKVEGLALAQRLVRLFDRRVKPQVECEGETRLRVSFAFQAADEFDDDQRFLSDEEIQQARDSMEVAHQKWRAAQGLRIRDEVVVAGHQLLRQRPPMEGELLSPANLYDQALRWCEKLVADKPTDDVAGNESKGDGPADPDLLRVALPTAVVAIAGLRDLLRVRKFYPDAIPETEANCLHEQLVTNLVSSAKLCKLEGLFEITRLPEPGEEGSDVELSALMGVLALHHPDSDAEPLSVEKVSANLTAVLRKCQEDVTEPVRDIVTRIQHAMMFDCRMPAPRGDDTFREPPRFLQMLRAYWRLTRQAILHATETPVSYRPNPLTPLIVNLRDRVNACLEKLGECLEVSDVRTSVSTITEILLSGDLDELQMGDTWTYEQVAIVDRFIEEARLRIGAKTYPLTAAEEMCLEQGQKAVNDYEERTKAEWTKMLKRDASSEKQTALASAATSTAEPQAEEEKIEPEQFKGGTMVFFADRVELCGVDICSGPRSKTRRRILELLAIGRGDTFVAYSGEQLAVEAGTNSIGRAIGDLRDHIARRLQTEANIACGRFDIIESGGEGYRFCKKLTVQFDGQGAATPITDIGGENDVRNVRNDDVRNVRNVLNGAAAKRRAWILEQLAAGKHLQAPHVKKRFTCSRKTAERDLQRLKNEGRIEFVGAPRTGYYRLVEGTEATA